MFKLLPHYFAVFILTYLSGNLTPGELQIQGSSLHFKYHFLLTIISLNSNSNVTGLDSFRVAFFPNENSADYRNFNIELTKIAPGGIGHQGFRAAIIYRDTDE